MNAYNAQCTQWALRDVLRDTVRAANAAAGYSYADAVYMWHRATRLVIAIRALNGAPGSDGHEYMPRIR